MKVTLLSHTPEPEKIVAAAARCCYSNDDPDKLLDEMTGEKAAKFLQKLNDLGHQSPLEHVSFTFAISGVSRALLAQITRHRLASFSVRSQRYCGFNNSDFVKPPSIKNSEVENIFDEAMIETKKNYDELIAAGIAKEDARMVLPNAAATSMVVTMNARELLHFFSLRCCTRAQWEIRSLADEMVKLVKQIAPNIFNKAGAACDQLGYCPEGKFSCGRAPTLDDLLALRTQPSALN
ncbi:MAG: FAD-dependent thymidylate synthase [Selenomonadaceae bacterium]|nr:FAD-dependent thymidylate synthase [Selenomonadaceae bacterium]